MTASFLCVLALAGQVQIMAESKRQQVIASLPEIADAEWNARLHDPATIWYDDRVMPVAYQHDGGFHWAGYNISGDAREAAKGHGRGGNANIEFPWRDAGGTHGVEGLEGVKALRLPKRSNGSVWPVVWFPSQRPGFLASSNVTEWIFPIGTAFFEVLSIEYERQNWVFEVRVRQREADHWGVDILRPFPTEAKLYARLQGIAPDYATRYVSRVEPAQLIDNLHPRRAFEARADRAWLPSFPPGLVAELLRGTTFTSAQGNTWSGTAGAPTTGDRFSIVPRNYAANFIGSESESCANCHRDVLKDAREFDRPRDWYGRVRGSDGIFSWHPIEPSAVSRNGFRLPVRFRKAFVDAGVIERYDPARHPANIYTRSPKL